MTTQVLWHASEYGYRVMVFRKQQVIDEYTAGNCHFDSQIYLEPGEPGTEDEATLRRFAQATARDFAGQYQTGYIKEDPFLDSL